ncbi:hypothetical protein LZC95_50070 [Pendulispora brunnea]|uniref:Uncharacterized protein n=1 Tax=Pendulispora brunnea TaxID=2905690 RepID=A0ABZ2KB20_9BACT
MLEFTAGDYARHHREIRSHEAREPMFHPVKDAVGNITLQPLGDQEKRAIAFRQEIQQWIALGRTAPDPIRAWVDIGPREAEILLSFSKGNRNEAEPTVSMYRRDIARNVWKKNHQGMAFAKSGWFGDGHHRCRAVIESGKTVRVGIDFGVDDDAFATADMGRGRSVPDQLALRGLKNSTKMVAALRLCMSLAERKLYTIKWSLDEVETAFTTHETAIHAFAKLGTSRLPASFWGTLIYAHPVATDVLERLGDDVVRGEGITGTAYTLREYLTRRDVARPDPFVVAQRTLYAAKACIEGRQLTKFAPRDTDSIFAWFAAQRGR